MAENQQKPKILFVISNLEVGGGAQRVAATVGSELHTKGYETHLLTFYEYPRKYPYTGIYHTRNEKPKPWYKKPFGVIARIWGIRRVCKENNIDVAVSFLPEASFYTLASKILFFNRVKMIVSVRNNPNNRNRLYRFLIRLLYPLADKVVPNARATEEILNREYGLTNTTTIYNPIDLEQVQKQAEKPVPNEYEWIKDRSPLFISVGRLTTQKGQWHLIRAFQKVVEEKPEATLIILGGGELREKLEQLISDCGLENDVFLLGNQTNVFPFLKASDCFVFTSLWEGLPNVLIEALAVGLPVISTDCKTGPREILAPEVGIDQEVTYPYQGEYGTLVPTLGSELLFLSSQKCLLSQTENQLVRCLKQAAEKDAHHLSRCPESFLLVTVLEKWEDVVM
ncbi:MAG: glycosyltransferase [Candidatus Paceibacterota bacterium]